MYILHIETSTGNCSVALSKNDHLITCYDMMEGMNHAAVLAPAIHQLLASASIKPKDLEAISVSSGPGSYTGLRVGSSTAKAMAYSLDIPIIGVPTLQSLAKAIFDRHPEAQYALPMIDARRKEVYTALYNRSMLEIWPVSAVILTESFFSDKVAKLGDIYSCGDGAIKIGDLALLAIQLKIDSDVLCSARHLVAPAWELKLKGEVDDPLHFIPFYLKPPNITEPKKVV